MRQTGKLIQRIPFTLVVLAAILMAGIGIQTFARDFFPHIMQLFGWDLDTLKEGRLYTLWIGLLFGSKPGHFFSILAIGIFGIGALEYRHGTRLAILGFLVIGPLSSLLSTLLLWPFDRPANAFVASYLHTLDMGSSSSSLVCWGLFTGGIKKRWRWVIFITTAIVLIWFLVYYKAVWGIDHLISFIIGFGFSFILIPRYRRLNLDTLKKV